ncbi:unnamed protein product [Trichogramma brassicae]|uniref:protein-tyrosine-phosphatase n=1 Tax=Trichogramma brassicae TaxID=86971 RepID=A0A6H5IGJ3_9HYME|nr:unnamed protein product [Trichogramma brassicae]
MIDSVSRRALSGSCGSYHVRSAELARDKKHKTLSATVVFLDDTQHSFQLDKKAKGQALLDLVFQHLELIEKDYFGLQYAENSSMSSTPTSDVMRWLDVSKLVKKQLRSKGGQFFFRVKFYVSDPSKLQEEYTRYQFYLQIRRDILQGKLQLPPATACLIASYTVQSEIGDYNPEEHGIGYISRLQLLPNQTEEMERKICELHKLHKGQLPSDAEFNFLDHAKRLDMYGVELHKARDSNNKEIYLGVTSVGLVVFQNNIRINVFSWVKIVKISFKRKQFLIQLRREQSENFDTLLGFNMQTYRSSKSLWKSCVEHHTFFRLHSPKMRSRRFPLALSSRFTYSGRTEFQTVEDGKHRSRVERTFIRSPSKKLLQGILPSLSEEKGKISGKSSRSSDNKVQLSGSCKPRSAWVEGNQSDEYVPEVPTQAVVGSDALSQSMLLIKEGLTSGVVVSRYESLYRKNLELTSLESKKPENIIKNRYRDISPYDVTRVVLMGSVDGDYINANYVNMEIPGSGIINRYIATQGPLPHTVMDFWQMVLEAGSTLVVMLTTLAERGRVKCHQYWPDLNDSLTIKNLIVKCRSETIEDTFIFREFVLIDTNTNEERDITHMQYCAWPDHGVPSDWRQFVLFTERVRAARCGSVEPAVVHCSAGIGRTGVLVLMETALCLIEANQPVYPLEIVRSMRDQRAMMIQNASQYKFVCEAVHNAYTEGIVKPLPEFNR